MVSSHRAVLKEQGKTAACADGEISAIAAVNNLTLVTRNTEDFNAYKNLFSIRKVKTFVFQTNRFISHSHYEKRDW